MRPAPPTPPLSLRAAIDVLNGPESPRDGAAWGALSREMRRHIQRRFHGETPAWAEDAVQTELLRWLEHHDARRDHRSPGAAFYEIAHPEAWCRVTVRRLLQRSSAAHNNHRTVEIEPHHLTSDADVGLEGLHAEADRMMRGDHPAWMRLVDASCATAAAGSGADRRMWADLLVRRTRDDLSLRDVALLAAPADVDASGEPTTASLQRAQRQPAIVASYLRRDLHELPGARPDDPDELDLLERFLHHLCPPRPRRKDTP